MLVFVVVLPSTLPLQKQEQPLEVRHLEVVETHHYASNTRQHTIRARRSRRIPPYFVVVENNAHQIPIGTMRFDAVNQGVMKESQARRAKFLALSREVYQKFRQAMIKDKVTDVHLGDAIEMLLREISKKGKDYALAPDIEVPSKILATKKIVKKTLHSSLSR